MSTQNQCLRAEIAKMLKLLSLLYKSDVLGVFKLYGHVSMMKHLYRTYPIGLHKQRCSDRMYLSCCPHVAICFIT